MVPLRREVKRVAQTEAMSDEIIPPDVLQYVTIFDDPESPLPTAKEILTYRQWLEFVEMPRLRKRGWPLRIDTDAAGRVALAILRTEKR